MTGEFEILLDNRALCGEGPTWDHDRGLLYWVDILRRELHVFDPATGDDRTHRMPVPIGAVALTSGTELVAAAGDGFALVDPDSGAFRPLPGSVEYGDRMNDGACDPRGRFLAGTLTYAREEGRSGLYRLDADGPALLVDGMTLANGIGWSPDGSLLYLVDTADRTVWRFDYDVPTGGIGPRQVFARFDERDGNPDGLAVDSAGNVWIAMAWKGDLRRHRPDGSPDAVLRAPTVRVSSLTFGGDDLRDVYVTAACFSYGEPDLVDDPHAGGLFRFRADIAGTTSTPWSGPA